MRKIAMPYEHLRRIRAWQGEIGDMVLCTGAALLQDFRDNYLVAFGGEWSVDYLLKHNPGLAFSDSLSV